ncbi:universal stress protein [Kineococcus rhizosphaerae]|uniref:Nucleotide-binding universal stress UspA family protein n=1 Tax=Kineococcus rhizosphaerae TaxID=559628 RepID=A0A2T0QY83_9ACTN|nr:universal stress protein [Kineococcus rhizosphaerae]PRY11170.1 nucleotide-binding universal stress UspA family protein [Kineococcus rhizosphaerae]
MSPVDRTLAYPRRYVVAYDGGRETLRWAGVLARSLEVGLDVVVVVRSDDPFGSHYPPFSDVVTEQAQGWAREALAEFGPDVDVRTEVRTAGSVPEGLLEAAADATAIVVGTTGGVLGVGTVARTLLHASPVPVLLVPRREPPGRVDHLYVAVGTRPGASAVLAEACEAAERTGLPLHVVSLVEVDEDSGADPELVARMNAAVEEVRGRTGPGNVSTEVGRGRTMAEAVSSIDWAPGGLLIVGSSRLAQGRQTFLGPTAARILRHVPVPVVVVPRGGAS